LTLTNELAAAGLISVEDRGGVRYVTMANPTRRNALTRAMLSELRDAFVLSGVEDSDANASQIRTVVLRGDPEGKAFSAGFDIRTIDDSERARGLDPIHEPATAIEECPVPTIALIDGAAFGGALEIAMACTIRVAGSTAKFGMPPAKLGLVYSATGLNRFLLHLTPGQASRVFLSGDSFDAKEARAIGLVDMLADQPGEMVESMARAICENAPIATSGMLDAIRRLSKPGGADASDLAEIERNRRKSLFSQDLLEGVLAFKEKRKPAFRGN
jgi:enoyl-CoA hydratase/carnithine racemase